MTTRAALLETKAVLRHADRTWARWSCPSTAECCQLATTRRPPWLWPSEWAVLEEHLAHEGRALPPPRADGGCPFLDESGKRCTVYEARPFGCRTFFCHRVRGPSKHPGEGTDALLRRLSALNLELDDAAQPRPLPEWYEERRHA
ncbi:MAG: YkgJ family cysteine cluster protein [Myxococcaceae bacterium]|nr:YkgJ family cysteine cluster protein [Myxococcaceae bacterium]